MSKVASAAAAMGVGEDQLAAQLSTIISATREAPETIGTSLKTIYARISDIQAGMADDGVDLGYYTGKMAEFGVNVLDAQGHLRDMGSVIEEIGGKWEGMNREQQITLAQTMAGQRQYSRLIALFDKWDEYTKSLETARNAQGTLQKQQDIYMESTAAHLQTLKAATENIYDSLLDTDTMNTLVDGLTDAANLVATFVDSLGGGILILSSLGSIGITVFSQQIAKSINTTITNFETAKNNAEQFKQALQITQEWKGIPGLEKIDEDLLNSREKLLELSRMMSPEQFKGLQTALSDINKVGNEIATLTEKQKNLDAAIEETAKEVLKQSDAWKSVNEIINSPEGQQKLLEQLQEQENRVKSLSNELKNYKEQLKTSGENFGFDRAKEDITEYFNTVKDLVDSNKLEQHRKQIETLQIELSKLDESVPDELLKAKFGAITTELNGIVTVAGKTATGIRQEFEKNIEGATDSIKTKIGTLKSALQQLTGDFNTGLNNMAQAATIENFAKLAGGISQVGMSIQTIQNLGSIWKNSDLEEGQKWLQTITNLSFTLPMLGSGLASMAKATGLVTIYTKAEAAAALEAGQAFEFLGVTMSFDPMLAWIAGITAVVGALGIANSALKQHREEIIETQKTKIEEQNQNQEQIKSHEQLYKSLEQLDKKYKDGQISRTELKSSVQELVDQYELQGDAANNLKNSYLDLTNAIKETREEQEKEYQDSLKREKRAARKSFQESLKGEGGIGDLLFGDYSKITFGAGNAVKNVQDYISKAFTSKGAKVSDNGVITYEIDFNTASEEELIHLYENIQAAVDKLESSGKINQEDLDRATSYQRATEFLKEYADEYKALKDVVEESNNELDNSRIKKIAQDVDLQNIKNTNDYLEKRTTLIKELQDQYDITYTKASTAVDEYLKKNHDSIYNQFSEISDSLDEFKDKIGGEIPESIESLITKLNDQQLTKFFELDPEEFQSWEDLNNTLTEISQKDFSNIKDAAQNYTYFSTLEEQISSGKNISKSEFEGLAERGAEQLQEFFDIAANGTYKLTGDAEQFYKLVDDFKLEGFYKTLNAIQQKIVDIRTAGEQFNVDNLNSIAINYGTDQNVAGPMMQGFDQEKLITQIEYLETAKTITEDQAEKWRELIENHQEDIDLCSQIAKKVSQTGDQSASLKKEWNQIQMQIHDALVPLDQDIDTTQLERLSELYMETADQIEGLNDGIKDNRDWAEDAAAAVLRYDDAIQNLVDNYEDWVSILRQGSQVEYVQIAEDLADAYQDLLDFVGDNALSDEFLRNADNLELFRIAAGESADGTEMAVDEIEAAYDRLMDLALDDIVAHLIVYDDSFYSDLQTIQDQIAEWNAQGLNDIQMNANLQNEDFIRSFNEMLQKTNAGVAQAENLIQAMAFDATVIETDPQVKTTDTENQYWVPASYHTEYLPAGGEQHQGAFAYTKMDQPGHWETVQGQTTSVIPGTGAVEIQSMHKSTGGGIKFLQSSNGGGSAGTTRKSSKRQSAASNAAREAEKQQKEIDAANKKAQQEAQRAAKEAQRAQEKADREAQQAAKKAQQQAEKAQKEWEKENSDTSQKDSKELIKDERDLYHDINIEIKAIDRELERVSKKQDRMYGRDLLNNLNKQTEILEKHKKKLKEKQQIQEIDLAQQRRSLQLLGATFDAYGNISNYMSVVAQKQELVNSLTREYNTLINFYNSSTNKTYKQGINDQLTAKAKEIDAANKALKDAQEAIKNYDALREAMEDITDQIEEETQKQIEINIKQFRMELEIRLDMREAEKDWNEFRRKVINRTDIIKDSDFSKIFKDAGQNLDDILSYYSIDNNKGTLETLTDQINATMTEIALIDSIGESAIYGDNKAQAMEDLQNDLKELQNQLIDINDLVDSIDQAYFDAIDDAEQHFDKQVEDYEYISKLIEGNMDLLTLLYGERQYDAMEKYYQSLNANNKQELEFLRQRGEYEKAQWDRAREAGNEQQAKKWEESYKNTVERVRDAMAKSAQDLQKEFTNSINKIFDELEKKLTNGKTFDYLDMEWDLINKNADEYLDTINSAFAIQELQNKFQTALNNTDNKNIKAQRQLKALMDEQLGNLRAKDKLTQYDVDRATKLLEIEQARIALEDARSSKTSMQLRRDSQGNYSYEYVADSDSILEAQQNLTAAQNELYNFDKDRYKSNLEDMYSAYKDFTEKTKELTERAKEGDAEAQAELALLTEQYNEYITNKIEENQNIRVNLMDSAFNEIASIYNTDVSNYQNMSEQEKQILMGDLVPTWNSGIQQMSDKIAGDGGLIPSCKSAFEEVHQVTKNYQDQLNDLATTAGYDLDDVRSGVDDVADSVQDLTWDNEDLIYTMDEEIETLQDLRYEAHALIREYNAVYSSAMAAVSAIQKFIQAQRAQAAAQAAKYGAGSSGSGSSGSNTSSGTSSSSASYSNSSYSAPPVTEELAEQIAGNIWFQGDWGNNPTRRAIMKEKWGDTEGQRLYTMVQEWFKLVNGRTQLTKSFSNSRSYYAGYGPSAFSSGGYTGEWPGNFGKIGILHEKEIVLNQDDTKNILDTVSILRSLSGNLQGAMAARLSGLRISSFNPNSDSDTIEQNVHIDASFPNVNSKREIEEAFNDLVNLAAQRVMRR